MEKKSSPGAFKKRAIPVCERTYGYLKSRVLSGGFNPGDRLTEEHLAEDPDLCGRLMGEQIREANDEALQTLLGKGERKQTEEKNFEGIKRRSSRLKKI